MRLTSAPGSHLFRHRLLVRLVAVSSVIALVTSGLSGAEAPRRSRSQPAQPIESALSTPICGSGTVVPASITSPTTLPEHQEIVSPAQTETRRVSYAGATVAIRPGAVRLPVGIGITPLERGKVPRLDSGMTNVTAGQRDGYRFTPHPMRFLTSVEVTLPYDPTLIGPDFTPQDVYTYWYDEAALCWQLLERVSVDEVNHTVTSLTDHFTDMINATVSVPDHPEGVQFNPNQLKGIKAGDPAAGVNLIVPPEATNQGDNRLSYKLEVPPGRQGLQPQLAVSYSSSSSNGWLGVGWDLATPTITIDTRWGVPRYESVEETETYLLNGAQLTPVAHRGAPQPRTAEKVFHTRVEGSFVRIVRHGTGPTTYTWEVTDKAGLRWFYGALPGAGPAADATLSDQFSNVYLWALREVRDPHGNFMRFHYAKVDDSGLVDGREAGRNLYPQRITYTGRDNTEGRYAVTFTRDRDLNEPLRVDKTMDARGGFKRVTADLLRRVDVTLDSTLIRRYELGYTTGAFAKTLLRSISQFDDHGVFFNKHEFDYFDDIRDAQGQYQAFGSAQWTVPGDSVSKSVLNLSPEQAGNASALSSNTSTGGGGHLYVGVGPAPSKAESVGLKVGFSHSSEEGVLALIDVDGDSLPDKVFRSGGSVKYRKNLSGPNGVLTFAAQAQALNLPGILDESSNTVTLGVEGYLGAVAAQLDYVNTFATTSQYFSDVNGDGITDLVTGASVLFGRVGPGGVPVYGIAADTPVPVGAGAVDTTGLFGNFTQDRERLIDSFPLLDSVRRWVAPFTGTIRVEGAVKLSDGTAAARAASQSVDGVRVAIQHENAELWSDTIGGHDNTAHDPVGVAAIPVNRGDRLYFRVQSAFDGGLDEVSWDPKVSYLGVPDPLDVNGLPSYRYQASRDFTLGGRTVQVKVPLTGTMHLSGDLTKKGATTDNVTVAITRDGVPVLEQTLAGGVTGTVPVNLDVTVQQGQTLAWRVRVDSPIDLDQIEWTPRAFYTAAPGVDRLFDDNGQPFIDVFPPYDVDMYPVDGLTAPQGFLHLDADATVTVEPHLTFDFAGAQPDGRVTFTVKRRGQLLAKRFFDIVDGVVTTPAAFDVPANDGDDLFFDFSTLDPKLRTFLTAQTVEVDGVLRPSAFHSSAEQGAFPQPYRGWAPVGYNGNRDRATQPIVQNDLVVDDDFQDQVPSTVDPQAQKDAFKADPRIDPPKAVPFTPSPQRGRWGAGEHSWVARAAVSSSRLGVDSINLPKPSDFVGAGAVPRLSRSEQISLTGSVGGSVGSLGGSIATGDSTGQVDFLDLNGDGFPDVVGAGSVQYSDMVGGLGDKRGTLPDGAVRHSTNESGNASAGSAARTISTGRGYDSPPGHSSANTAQSGNDMPPLGVGGSIGGSSSDGQFDLLDVNGDNLPDRVYGDGQVALNLGYRFGAREQWRNPAALNNGDGSNVGLNIGFNTDFYGFAGGASYSEGSSSSSSTLVDMNGDGLADRVFAGNPIQVGLNTGNGFEPAVDFHGSLSQLNGDQNAKLGGGVYFTFSICFILVCIIINPGGDISTGASRTEQVLRDINGDGFADHLASTRDNQLTVVQNKTDRTNLLRGVTRPLGARMDFDYRRDGNTYGQPHSRWVLSRVSVNDGQPGDGQDVQVVTYEYADGVYDRLEREFYGYGTVVERHRDAGAGDAVRRSVTRDFHTDSHYTRGLVRRELTTDGAGRPFLEVANTYAGKDIANPGGPADLKSTTATIFPQLLRTDRRFFEGQAAPGKATFVSMEYDAFGNVTRSIDSADTGTADDVDVRIRYTAEKAACQTSYIVGVPDRIDVFGAGTLMRHRESIVDCVTANVTQVKAMLAGGEAATTDLEFLPSGNIRSVTGPANKIGQRYRLDYTYDPTVDTHIESITDSFGYVSRATHNLKFGLAETTTDVNQQTITNTYDPVGRLDSVVGPYEAAEGRLTIDFEYHPEAAYPYAVTRHVDREASGAARADTIDTVTFVDGLKRMTQTKKDAAVHTGAATAPQDVMVVSGRVVFDFLGRKIQELYPVSEPKGPANTTFNQSFDVVQATVTTYDVLDRTTSTVLPDNTSTTYTRGFGPDRSGTTMFETVITDANGKTRRTYNDVRQLTTSVKEFNPAGGQAVIWTSYSYDPLSQMTGAVDDRGNVTTSAYDNLGRRTTVTNPDSGTTETVYDLAGNEIKKITANLAAVQKAIEYDYAFNRVTAIRYPVFPANNVSYVYGAPGAAHNSANRVTNIVDGAGTMAREYGPLGEIVKETRTTPAQGSHVSTFVTEYRYETFNRMLGITFPDGEVLSYHYNSGGQVDSATGVKGEFTYHYLARLDYDKFEQRVLLDTGNGTRTQYTFNDADRRLDNLKANLANGYVFHNLNYGYDGVGNILSIQNDTVAPSGPEVGMQVGGPSTQAFQYDDLYRLTHAEGSYEPRTPRTDRYRVDLHYDTIHNLTDKTQVHELVSGGNTIVEGKLSYGYDYAYAGGKPHAPATIGLYTLAYDANGNQISRDQQPRPRRQMIWDEENRLACSHENVQSQTLPQTPASCDNAGGTPNSARYLYDDQGTRVVKDGAQFHIYPNQHFSTRGNQQYKHVYIGHTKLITKFVEPEHRVEDRQYYAHTDHLGSTGFVTDDQGGLAEHTQYFPGGETWVSEHPSQPVPQQFTGKELDQETNLYYFGARYYDPRTQVWQTPDPALPNSVRDPKDLSAYLYGGANPLKLIDPDGRQTVDPEALGDEIMLPGNRFRTETYTENRTVTETVSRRGGGSVMSGALMAGAVASQLDTPVPGPGDVVGAGIIVGGALIAGALWLTTSTTITRTRVEPITRTRTLENPLTYVTYTKFNAVTGETYTGRSSGYGTPQSIIAARDAGHHMTALGFGPAVLDQAVQATRPFAARHFDPSYQAIRGREQQMIDALGGSWSDVGRGNTLSGNAIRGVSAINPLGLVYHSQASAMFGQIAPYTGY